MLPTLEYSTYETYIPSTKQKLTYRPYTVGEEKVLLTAAEGEDINEIANAIKSLIKVCCDCEAKNIDVDKLPSYDIEYLFLILRSSSVGNNVEMTYTKEHKNPKTGEECDQQTDIEIDLSDATIQISNEQTGEWSEITPKDKTTEKIMITDKVGLICGHLSLDDTNKIANEPSMSLQSNIGIMCSIKEIFDEDTVYQDFTDKELEHFVQTLPVSTKTKILEFLDKSTPVLRLVHPVKCQACGYEDEIELIGLSDFFA